MALNLSRNSRLWVSTVAPGGTFNNNNTFEIPLQEDFSFTQSNTFEDVTVEEAGPTPTRGSKRFNSTLEPVEWNFSTYISPYIFTDGANGNKHMVVDALLWHALASGSAPDLANGDTAPVGAEATEFTVAFTDNSFHVLTKLYLYFLVDNKLFVIKDAQVNTADISVDISDIAQVGWSGQGTEILTPASLPTFMVETTRGDNALPYVDTDETPTADKYVAIPATKQYLLNKLTVMTMTSNVRDGSTMDGYNIPITGANISINNNVTFVTPSTLSEVDLPVGSFTGSFEVTGSIDAYLRDGLGVKDGTPGNEFGTVGLYENMVANRETTTVTNIALNVGGAANPVAIITMPKAQISIPSINIDSVVSQSFEFKAMPDTDDLNDGLEIGLSIRAST